eukprot:m.287455 g.287455  ORF g.287455 m.287455 type:complete len:344 (+) comp15790_c2_seq12:278-1309(+)
MGYEAGRPTQTAIYFTSRNRPPTTSSRQETATEFSKHHQVAERRAQTRAMSKVDNGEVWLLHRAALEGNDCLMEKGLASEFALAHINSTDKHGNTPLLLAILQSRAGMVQQLLDAGASCKPRSKQSPLSEAISVGNIDVVRAVLKASKLESAQKTLQQITTAGKKLANLPDFELQMSWEISSWLPLISRALPSDTVLIRKSGTSIRLDTTLRRDGLATAGKHGNLSILVNIDRAGEPVVDVVDHDKEEHKRLSNCFKGGWAEDLSADELEARVVKSLVTPQHDGDLVGNDAAVQRSTTLCGNPKVKQIGSFKCDGYSVSDLSFVSSSIKLVQLVGGGWEQSVP